MERERKGPFQEGAKYGKHHLGNASPARNIPDEKIIADYARRQREKAGR